jgi:hypothetical protein
MIPPIIGMPYRALNQTAAKLRTQMLTRNARGPVRAAAPPDRSKDRWAARRDTPGLAEARARIRRARMLAEIRRDRY